MPEMATEGRLLEYARSVVQISPELEQEKSAEVQNILMKVIREVCPRPEEIAPEAIRKFCERQNYFEALPDPT